MTLELLKPIANYFDADRSRDAEAVARCFTEGATVRDAGQNHAGRDAIRQWKADASAKFNYTVEPMRAEFEGSRIVVTSRVAGDFPGSPTALRYFFDLSGEKISALEIVP